MSKIDGGLRALFREHLPAFDWCSIESGSTGGGIPDSNYCVRTSGIRDYGTEGWIEHKRADAWAVTLEPEQVGWIARRVRNGGRVHVAVRRRHQGGPRLGPPVDELHLFGGRWAKEAKAHGLRGPWALAHGAVHVWHGGPSKGWDWDAVAAALLA